MRNKLKESLLLYDQEHLIGDVDSMNESDIVRCAEQIRQWSFDLVFEQKRSWQTRRSLLFFELLKECLQSQDQQIGAQPRIGILILAGGQGSRLGISGPKGCFPLLGKSLFERHCEKIRMKNAPLAILTSSLNHQETVTFFEKNHLFGLQDVTFFSQKTLPLLDETGHWFWEEKGHVAEGADGNGSVFQSFLQAGVWDRFAQKGVEAVHIVPVDNPLADPFDPVFLSFYKACQADLAVKCFRLADPIEPTGRLVQRGLQLGIAEFAELTDEQRNRNLFANTGLLAIDIHLMRFLANQIFPLHWACRAATHWENGKSYKKDSWKAERFIVDALSYAKNGRTICHPREECYAPLKEKNSIPQGERMLLINKMFEMTNLI
jgi:UDP-N-acetylglucosamine/UDP-N-acetylgalactosamine diphosphorylase